MTAMHCCSTFQPFSPSFLSDVYPLPLCPSLSPLTANRNHQEYCNISTPSLSFSSSDSSDSGLYDGITNAGCTGGIYSSFGVFFAIDNDADSSEELNQNCFESCVKAPPPSYLEHLLLSDNSGFDNNAHYVSKFPDSLEPFAENRFDCLSRTAPAPHSSENCLNGNAINVQLHQQLMANSTEVVGNFYDTFSTFDADFWQMRDDADSYFSSSIFMEMGTCPTSPISSSPFSSPSSSLSSSPVQDTWSSMNHSPGFSCHSIINKNNNDIVGSSNNSSSTSTTTLCNNNSGSSSSNDYLFLNDIEQLTCKKQSNVKSKTTIDVSKVCVLQGRLNVILDHFGSQNVGSTHVQLWQFLLELLANPDLAEGCIQWEGGDGEFRMVDPEEVARKWGRRKRRSRMNFEKMGRALRYYYDKLILKKVAGKKWTYQFNLTGILCQGKKQLQDCFEKFERNNHVTFKRRI